MHWDDWGHVSLILFARGGQGQRVVGHTGYTRSGSRQEPRNAVALERYTDDEQSGCFALGFDNMLFDFSCQR